MADDRPQDEVLTSLPRTRPQRRSERRKPAAATAKRASAAKAPSAPKRNPTAAKAVPKAKAARRPPRGPILPPGDRHAPPPAQMGGPELVGTVVRAAGELAQVGLTVGVQAARRALGRLPRP